MNRGALLAGIVGVGTAGCVTDQITHYDRPARLEVGVNSRRFQSPVAAPAAADHVALRSTTTPAPTETPIAHDSGTTATAQFTMATPFHTYLGGEVEAGELEQPGSNVAAGYAVVGSRFGSRFGSLSVELAGGYRSLRENFVSGEVGKAVFEPRVRGQFWLTSQLALGAAAGATLGEQGSWMAGIYLGVHSHAFGSDR